jgi:hypothetical protein
VDCSQNLRGGVLVTHTRPRFILSSRLESHQFQVVMPHTKIIYYKFLVNDGAGSNPKPLTLEADTVTTEPFRLAVLLIPCLLVHDRAGSNPEPLTLEADTVPHSHPGSLSLIPCLLNPNVTAPS